MFAKSHKFLLLILLLQSTSVFAQSILYDPQYFDYDKLSLKFSESVCSEYKNGVKLKVPLDHSSVKKTPHIHEDSPSFQSQKTQDLFYYFVQEFDQSKKTILINFGGPGAVYGPMSEPQKMLSTIYNVVVYHSRGSGCSAEPMTAEANKFITPDSEVEDVEQIRKHIGLEKWDVIYGISAGTNLARYYAHKYPNRVIKIVLNGVAGEDTSKIEDKIAANEEIRKINQSVWKRFVEKERINLLNRYSDNEIKVLGEKFVNFMDQADVVWAILNFRQNLKEEYKDEYPLPTTSRDLNILPLVLSYIASDKEVASAYLLEFIKYYQYSGLDLAGHNLYAEAYSDAFYKALLNENFDPYSDDSYGLSFRVQSLHYADVPAIKSTCHKVPQLIIQGAEDQATPVKNADDIFNNSSCYPNQTVYVKNDSAGHFDSVSELCELTLISRLLTDSIPFEFPGAEFCSQKLIFQQR